MRNSLLCACLALVIVSFAAFENTAEARRKRAYRGPLPTHPVILWSRTIDESKDAEARKVAAFKLSQFSQPIFQTKVVSTLITCTTDSDVQIKVLCTKALGGVRSASQEEKVREVLMSQYGAESVLKNTIVRVFISRKDVHPSVQKLLLDSLFKTEDTEETLVLLSYFQSFDAPNAELADRLVDLYEKRSNIKVRRAIVRVLDAKAKGQDKVIELLAKCAQERDTPLALVCLGGLQTQAKKDERAWAAVQKTILSSDPDVLLATLDVINALPETKNPVVSHRLVELIEDAEDPDVQEKAVLALGVCGDQSEETVKMLQKVFKNDQSEEATRIAAALTLGKQAALLPDRTRELFGECLSEKNSQTLKTACQLALNELPKATPAPASTTEAQTIKDAKEATTN